MTTTTQVTKKLERFGVYCRHWPSDTCKQGNCPHCESLLTNVSQACNDARLDENKLMLERFKGKRNKDFFDLELIDRRKQLEEGR